MFKDLNDKRVLEFLNSLENDKLRDFYVNIVKIMPESMFSMDNEENKVWKGWNKDFLYNNMQNIDSKTFQNLATPINKKLRKGGVFYKFDSLWKTKSEFDKVNLFVYIYARSNRFEIPD